MNPPQVKCPKCPEDPRRPGTGTGLIPHVKRQLIYDGKSVDDPTDFQTEETCDKCNGRGVVGYTPGDVKEPEPPPAAPIC